MRLSMLRCRRRRPPSCWNNTKRKARLPCLLRKNPTREAQHQREVVACVEVAEAARTSLAAAVDLDREVVAVEASRTEATLEEVGWIFRHLICSQCMFSLRRLCF